MLSIKAGNKETTSFFIKTLVQALASTKEWIFPRTPVNLVYDIAKQITEIYNFLHSWTKNFWNNRYIWMKFERLWFLKYLKYFFFKQSRHDTKEGDTPANKWDLFKNYVLEKVLLTSAINALEIFMTFSGKLIGWVPSF